MAIYEHLPMLVVQLSADGIVLHCNPETERVTGYDRCDLVGKNFWALLFPGRLFAQIPRFISPASPSPSNPLLRDTPLTVRTKSGKERVIAFTRFVHAAGGTSGTAALDLADVPPRSMVCLGVDLTDRLLDADKLDPDNPDNAGGGNPARAADGFVPFGTNTDDPPDGDFVTPLAISPPAPATGALAGGRELARQVEEGLALMESRLAALREAATGGEAARMAALALAVRDAVAGIDAARIDATGRLAQIETTALVHAALTLVPRAEEIAAQPRRKEH